MVLCVCKCLNVSLESDKIDDNVDVGKLELTSMEQRDIFFSEKLMSCAPNTLKSQVVQPTLVGQRPIGRGTLHSCLACGQNTHAMVQDKNGMIVALLPKCIETNQDRVNTLKKSKNFSPVFNLLVPDFTSDIEMKENVDTNNLITNEKSLNLPTHQVISTLSKQMNQILQAQLESVEETVRQFRDQKYAEFEAYRERAHRDNKILASIVNKARSTLDNSWSESGLQNGPPSPQLPPLQRRRLSSIKDGKKITHNFAKVHKSLPPDDDFDAEEVFDLDDINSRNNMVSDSEDYNSDATQNKAGAAAASAEDLKRRKYSNIESCYIFEPFGVETLGSWGPRAKHLYKDLAARLVDATRDQNAGLYFAQRISIAIQRGNSASILGTLPTDGSNDEGIAVTRPRGGGGAPDIARSLPMNMPHFPKGSNSREPDDDDYEVPTDLAASIQALARSVHGDVFDLPRPRFSTQI